MQLTDLPPLALVALGISLAVIIAANRLGWMQGTKTAPTSASATVAAVIVDPTALNRASAAVDSLTAALAEITTIAREFAKTQEQMADEMDPLREEVRIGRETHRR
jgi:tRNA nucleotidyltransferase (CCA-adding enzyme)